jgi:uncharacterized membrane protein/protein-disulfide isomerase
MTPLSRRLLVIFAIVGLAAASASSYVHHKLLTVPGYASICDISSAFNCSQAYTSRYGSLWGVPVAVAGMTFFALVLILAVFAGRPKSAAHDTAPAYIFVLSTIGLAFVLYLGWASYFVLKTLCILCAITYVSVIAIFIISGGAVSFPMTKLPRRAVRDLRTLLTSPLALAVAVLFAGAAWTVVAAFPDGPPLSLEAVPQDATKLNDEQRRELEKWYAVQPTVDVPVPNDGAKVLILKFSDFQCPACKAAHDAYRPVLAKYAPNQVKYILKHYPLEMECNTALKQDIHPAACEAAAAVVMAKPSGQADRLKDFLFANQPTLTSATVKQAAKDVAGIADFDARYARALQEVKTDASLGTLLQVKSTPTFFVNGKRIEGGVPPQYFEGIIEMELKKAK